VRKLAHSEPLIQTILKHENWFKSTFHMVDLPGVKQML
jgi:hypothetical protein